MSIKSSNLYAQRILKEHPLAMWSLDDSVDYISLISNSTRDISTWTTNNTATVTSVSDSTAPFPTNYVTKITGTQTPTFNTDAYSFLSSINSFTSTSGTFTLSFYLKTQYRAAISAGFGTGLSATIQSAVPNVPSGQVSYVTYTTTANHNFNNGDYVQITGVSPEAYDTAGFVANATNNTFRIYSNASEGQGTGSGGTALSAKTQSVFIDPAQYPKDSWIPVSFTFSDSISSQKILLGFSYAQVSPEFFINGLTVGKDSENFNGESLGQTLSALPANISTTQTEGMESKSFGTEEYSAYYIGSGNNIFAKNAGMPMSYGSENSMVISPHTTSGQPSFIFPGFGMLNNAGRYRRITLEALIRITANNSIPKRIIGPISSKDGIYVTKDIITLKIGDSVGSFNLSEMYKPMILQLRIEKNFAVLSIDGEQVISLSFISSELSLPNEFDENLKSQDWVGIYGYTDIPSIEIDSIALYPYISSDILAKRRFVFAQGLDVPNVANNEYNGITILPGFSFAEYSNNYNYPSFQSQWNQSVIFDNLEVTNNEKVVCQTYSQPKVIGNLYNYDKFLLDLYETNIASGESNVFVNLRPTSVVSNSGRNWSTHQGYLETIASDNINFLSNCVYGIFKCTQSSATEQILLKIVNTKNNKYFKVSITNTTISYKYSEDAQNIQNVSITQGNIFAIGFDINKIISGNSSLSSFFENKNDLSVYIGGHAPGTANTFTGNIYKVGFCSDLDFATISNLFGANGILTNHNSYSTLLAKTASYTISPIKALDKIFIDVGTVGYWQDYVPLLKLAKTVIGNNGEPTTALDFIQINVDYAEPREYSSNNFNTSNSMIKTYISFQPISSGFNKNANQFASTESANKNRVINATTFNANKKYEFVNGMIIYPPTDVALDTLAIVVHVEIKTESCKLKPIGIKFLELAAQSFNKNSANFIGTPNSIGVTYQRKLYPYTYDPSNSNTEETKPYNYDSSNPYLVYKQDTPYLYLTRHSGFRIVGDAPAYHRGLYFDMQNFSLDKKITTLQFSIMPDIKEFTNKTILVLKTNSKNIYFSIVPVTGDSSKAYIECTDSLLNISYYVNGKKVGKPYVKLNQWSVIGINFTSPLDISNSDSKLFITSDLLMTNIGCFYTNPIELDQKSSNLTWKDILDNNLDDASNTWAISVPTQSPTRDGSLITITTGTKHNLVIGEPIQFSGLVPSGYMYPPSGQTLTVVSIPTVTSFTYQNSLAPQGNITTAGTVLGTWQYASIPNYYKIYSNNPKEIYQAFTGTANKVIDTYQDSQKLMFNSYQYVGYMDVKINTLLLDTA